MASAGISIEVSANTEQLARAIRRLGEKQIPFIIAKSLTKLAQEGRDSVRGGLDEHFTIRNKRVERGITMERAEKKDWPDIFSVVGSKDEFMVQHVTGEDKRPRSGRHVAIPSVSEGGRTGAIKRTASGAIPSQMKPRAVLSGGRRAFVQRIAHGGHTQGAPRAVMTLNKQKTAYNLVNVGYSQGRNYTKNRATGSGNLAVLQRVGKNRYPLKFLYGFKDSAKIKKKDWFSRPVQMVVTRRYPAIFEEVMKEAFEEEARKLTENRTR